jgi:hypothetical protein
MNWHPVVPIPALIPVIFVLQNLAHRRGSILSLADEFLYVLLGCPILFFEQQIDQFRCCHLCIIDHSVTTSTDNLIAHRKSRVIAPRRSVCYIDYDVRSRRQKV